MKSVVSPPSWPSSHIEAHAKPLLPRRLLPPKATRGGCFILLQSRSAWLAVVDTHTYAPWQSPEAAACLQAYVLVP